MIDFMVSIMRLTSGNNYVQFTSIFGHKNIDFDISFKMKCSSALRNNSPLSSSILLFLSLRSARGYSFKILFILSTGSGTCA